DGQSSRAATSVSWVSSSASGTSRSIRDNNVIRRGCSMRQAARMAAWMLAAVIAADLVSAPASGMRGRLDFTALQFHALADHGAQLAGALPARHVVEMELHDLPGHCQRLGLVAELEDGVTADHFLGFHERAVGDAELAAFDRDVRALLQRGQSAHV